MSHIYVDLPYTNNKLVEFRLANVDTFIIHVGFELTNVHDLYINMIRIQSMTQIATHIDDI